MVTECSIHGFGFRSLNHLDLFITCANPNGLFEIANSSFNLVMAYPNVVVDQIVVTSLTCPSIIVNAYKGWMITCMLMTTNGGLLAASCNGNNTIKIFDTSTENLHKWV